MSPRTRRANRRGEILGAGETEGKGGEDWRDLGWSRWVDGGAQEERCTNPGKRIGFIETVYSRFGKE
jgi:hypothetical protein